MTTFTDVFERKEVKYRLDARQHRAMAATLRGRMAPDAFGRTRIVSRYFDTPERALIERSLDKPLYKEKLRLRSYGSSQADDRVFVEIKKKYKGIVYKRRVGCSLAAAEAYLGGESYEQACARFPLPDPAMAAESLSPRSVQIAREIDEFVARYRPLRPSMLIECERVAYASIATIVAIDAYATRSHSMSIEGRNGRYRATNSSISRAICTLRGDSDSAAIAGSGSGNRAQACSYDSPPR